MQFVRLVNEDTRTYDFHQSNRKRILQPGQEAMVPWDIACSLFGDPATTDTPKERARTRAWKQAAGIHNFSEGNMTLEDWEAIRPKIAVYDVETGSRVFMVLEDRDGDKAGTNPNVTDTNAAMNVSFLTTRIAEMEKTMTAMAQMLLAQQQGSPLLGQQVTMSTDAPPSFPLPPTAGVESTVPATLPGVSDPVPTTPVAVQVPGEDAPPPARTPAVTTQQPSEDTPQTVPTVIPSTSATKGTKLAAKAG